MATVTKPIALDESLNTTEQTPRNVADVLAQELARIAGRQASDVNYDNTDSGLTADNVQDAIDELKSDIPTVNDGTLTIQQNGETKGTFTANQSGNSTVNIETPTTDIQTAVDEFETYNGGLLSECKVALSPNQDLHGYDHPYIGGAGKNLFNPTALTTTQDGVTFTNNGNGTYTLNGTATADIDFPIESFSVPTPNVQYKMVGCPSGLSSNAILQIRGTSWYDDGNGSIATTGDTNVRSVQIRVKNGATFNNVVFKPMFSLDTTITYDDFEPYENICPISGHTQVDVRCTGHNIWDEEWEIGKYNTSTGEKAYSRTTIRSVNKIAVSPNTAYYCRKGTTAASSNFTLLFYDAEYNFLNVHYKNSGEFVTPNGAAYMAFDMNIGYGTTYNHDIAINFPATFTEYEPYNGYQITVNLGGTYYSGTLDVVSGVLTVDKGYTEYDGSSDEVWNRHSYSTDVVNAYYISANLGQKNVADGKNGQFNQIQLGSISTSPAGDNAVGFVGRNTVQLRLDAMKSANELKTYLAEHPLQVVYELATPLTIQLTPQQVKALVGENHLSTPLDGQEITESKYKKMFTFDDVIAYIQSL